MKPMRKLTVIFTAAALLYVCKQNMSSKTDMGLPESAEKKHEKVNFAKLDSLVKSFESCELEAYRDSRGIPTIGWGHTGKDVHMARVISQETADSLLRKDIHTAYKIVQKHVKVKMNSDQTIAVTSFVYNVGPGSKNKDGFVMTKEGKPSRFLSLLNEGKFKAAATEMNKWCYAGEKKLKGLEKRRKTESKLLTPKH